MLRTVRLAGLLSSSLQQKEEDNFNRCYGGKLWWLPEAWLGKGARDSVVSKTCDGKPKLKLAQSLHEEKREKGEKDEQAF